MDFRRASLETCADATDTAVVIDVLRAFSTTAYALAAGVDSIALVGTVAEAFALKKRFPDVLLMGEVDGLPIEGFDFGNSPSPFETLDLKGRRMVARTTAGTQGMVRSRHARHLVAGSFCCAGATAAYLRRLAPKAVTFVPTGFGRKAGQGDEDSACADYLEALLRGDEPDVGPYLEHVRMSETAGKFLDPRQPEFPMQDLECCLRVDRFNFAMVVEREMDRLLLKRVTNGEDLS